MNAAYTANLQTLPGRDIKVRVVSCDCCGKAPAKTRIYDAVKVVTMNVCAGCKGAK